MDDIEPAVVIGVDEVGRGAIAGPLVVAAVAFEVGIAPVTAQHKEKTLTAYDSKSFKNPAHLEALDINIRKTALYSSVIQRNAHEIDARLMWTVFPEAIKMAVSRVVERLHMLGKWPSPDHYLVMLDGELDIPAGSFPCPHQCIVDGDKHVWQIGAASIVAKVYRDNYMRDLAERYPEWDFDKHKGYPTPWHLGMLKRQPLTPEHRKSFRPVMDQLGPRPGFED